MWVRFFFLFANGRKVYLVRLSPAFREVSHFYYFCWFEKKENWSFSDSAPLVSKNITIAFL